VLLELSSSSGTVGLGGLADDVLGLFVFSITADGVFFVTGPENIKNIATSFTS